MTAYCSLTKALGLYLNSMTEELTNEVLFCVQGAAAARTVPIRFMTEAIISKIDAVPILALLSTTITTMPKETPILPIAKVKTGKSLLIKLTDQFVPSFFTRRTRRQVGDRNEKMQASAIKVRAAYSFPQTLDPSHKRLLVSRSVHWHAPKSFRQPRHIPV